MPPKPNTHTHSCSTPTLPPLPLWVGADQPRVTWVAKRPLQSLREHRFPPTILTSGFFASADTPPTSQHHQPPTRPPSTSCLARGRRSDGLGGGDGWQFPFSATERFMTGMPGFPQQKMLLDAKADVLTDIQCDTHAATGYFQLATTAKKKTANWTSIAWFIAICLEVVWETPMLLLQIMTCLFYLFLFLFFTFFKFLGCLWNTSMLRHKKARL